MKPAKGGAPMGKFKAQTKKSVGAAKGPKDMNNKKDEGSAQRMVGVDTISTRRNRRKVSPLFGVLVVYTGV
jgi:hypothetical protein